MCSHHNRQPALAALDKEMDGPRAAPTPHGPPSTAPA